MTKWTATRTWPPAQLAAQPTPCSCLCERVLSYWYNSRCLLSAMVLQPAEAVISRFRKLASMFRRSPLLMLVLRMYQKQNGRQWLVFLLVCPLRLSLSRRSQDVVTRWDSTYRMLSRIMQLRHDVEDVAKEQSQQYKKPVKKVCSLCIVCRL